VTGFGLAGHLLEICKGSNLTARVDYRALPILPNVPAYIADGCVTGASGRNWTSYGDSIVLGAGLGDVERALLTDPQTSGGLLVACAPELEAEVLAIFRAQGFARATVIGEMAAGAPRIEVAA